MKLLSTMAVALALTTSAACAQTGQSPAPQPQAQRPAHHGPDLAAQRAAMERLSWMIGDWAGEAALAWPRPMTVHQFERVEAEMDGLLLVIRGHGYADASRSGPPVFRALGVISYDEARGVYDFRVYNDGRATTAQARFLDDGRLQWSMDFAPVLIRYTIANDGGRWTEVGEMSRDNGATWTQTISMNLSRAR